MNGPSLRAAMLAAALLLPIAGVPGLPLSSLATAQQSVSATNPIIAEIGDDDMVRYRVRQGDTLIALARDYMIRPDAWQQVQRINRVRDPYRLPIGSTLTIPVHLLRTVPLTARIAAFKGAGQLENEAGQRMPMAVNLPVAPGTIITTGPGSFVTLVLSNGSRLSLPSQTRLRVTTVRRFVLNDMIDVNFALENGRVETSATPLGDKGGRYRIRTPIAVSAVRGTVFRVGYEQGKPTSLTEVIEGKVGVGTQATAPTQLVEMGFGATASASGTIDTEALLPPPELLNPGKVQVDPQVELAIAPQASAVGYHIQIARDAGFIEMEQEATVIEPVARFDSLPNGRWFVRVTAIAASGLEGMPQNYSMRRLLIGLKASAEQADDGAYRFRWNSAGEGRQLYHFRLRKEAPGSAPLVDEVGLTSEVLELTDIPPGRYRWSIGAQVFQDGETAVSWLPEQPLIIADEKNSRTAKSR